MSKVIKIEELSEEEIRWVKYRREKLAEQGSDVGQCGLPAGGCTDPARIVAESRAEAERIRREAFESGFAEGRQEGLAKVAAEVQSALSVLRNLAQSLKEEQQRVLNEIEPDIVRLAVEVARKIIGKEIVVDREIVKRCVTQAVEKIVEREKLIVSVNPVDLPAVMEYKAELMGMFDGIKEIEVVGDENGISPGGCTVETDLVKANGKIEAQLEEILHGILE